MERVHNGGNKEIIIERVHEGGNKENIVERDCITVETKRL